MARSIFLERILRSFVGSINDILDDLKISVENIVDDISGMDQQLDSVKDKIDQAIIAIGAGLQNVNVTNERADQITIISDTQRDSWADGAVYPLGTLLSMAEGFIAINLFYRESVSRNQSVGTAHTFSLQYRITPDGGTAGAWTTAASSSALPAGGTPEDKNAKSNGIQIALKDKIEFQIAAGEHLSSYTMTKPIFYKAQIEYGIVSVTEPGGAFIRG